MARRIPFIADTATAGPRRSVSHTSEHGPDADKFRGTLPLAVRARSEGEMVIVPLGLEGIRQFDVLHDPAAEAHILLIVRAVLQRRFS